jgi:hypothetical protein
MLGQQFVESVPLNMAARGMSRTRSDILPALAWLTISSKLIEDLAEEKKIKVLDCRWAGVRQHRCSFVNWAASALISDRFYENQPLSAAWLCMQQQSLSVAASFFFWFQVSSCLALCTGRSLRASTSRRLCITLTGPYLQLLCCQLSLTLYVP